MSIYDVDFKQQIIELLPPDKRFTNIISFLSACSKSTLQYLRDALFDDYKKGSTVGEWQENYAYTRGNKVKYKKAIYVSLVDENTDLPTAETWYMQQQFFIGLNERLMYNGNNLVLTYALNKWFGTVFRQPGQGISDIFIITNQIIPDSFLVGYFDYESSAVGLESSDQYISNDFNTGIQFNATVNVPKSLYDKLQPAAEALIRSFVDQYIYSGVTYQILVY